MNKSSKDNKATTVTQTKLAVFEEDDYFEEFDDEDYEGGVKEDIDFTKWQEEWEDEEINDQFEKVLRREMDKFKSGAVNSK